MGNQNQVANSAGHGGDDPSSDQPVPSPSATGLPASSGTTSDAQQGHKARHASSQPGGLRALRRAIPTFRSLSARQQGESVEYKGRPAHLILSAALLTVVITFIMSVPLLPGQVELQPGTPATQDIFAPGYLRYESKTLTEQARETARNDPANEVWVQDSSLVQQNRSILQDNLSALDIVRVNESMDPPVPARREPTFQGITVTEGMLSVLVALPQAEYMAWRDSGVLASYDANMRGRRLASEADVSAARAALADRLPPSLSQDEKEAAVSFVSPMLTVNMRLDDGQTAQRREQAAANVKPVIQVVQKGEAILRQGELATPEAIEKMQEAGLLRRDLTFLGVTGTGALIGMFMLLLHLYIYRYTPLVWQRQRQLLLVGLLIVVTLTVARLFLPGHSLLPYLLPLAAVSMLIAVLINTNVAVLVTLILSVITVLIATGTNLSMDLTLYYFVSGLAGIFSLTRVERVSTFARAGAFISLSAFLTVLTLKVITAVPLDWTALQSLALASLFNGIVSASITYGAFSLLGTLFGITTPVQLMELAHPDQPVLRRLMREAPGTYHHSLVVSNLAERAAEMIGADALLTRVCAYYHDIGKVVHPYYFIDNQTGMKNVHDTLDPRESASIIAGHVRDGLELGRKHRLPRRVLDAIPQHHGTMLIQYFYHKALLNDPTANPDDFRYPGPKPQSKENAILMLADGVEATVRAMAQAGALDRPPVQNSESVGIYNDTASVPNDTLVHTVHRIISERIEDGQLDECDLTVRDIARIQEAFVSMLRGIYHPRVQYPGAQGAPQQAGMGEGRKSGAEGPITSPLASGPAPGGIAQPANGYGNGHSAVLNGAANAVEPGVEARNMEASR